MGCTQSKEQVQENVGVEETEEERLNAIKQRRKQELQKIASKWRTDVNDIVKRDPVQLPIATDLPRLCGSVTVTRAGTTLIPDPSSSKKKKGKGKKAAAAAATTSPHQAVQSIVMTLVKELDGDETASKVKNGMDRCFTADGSGDLGEQLKALIGAELAGTNAVIVLASMHQRVIFPPHYYLKSALEDWYADVKTADDPDDPFKYKDAKGHWTVSVFILPKAVQVMHSRRVQGVASNPSDPPPFHFDWQLSMKFGRDPKTGALTADAPVQNVAVGVASVQMDRDHVSCPQHADAFKTKLLSLHEPLCSAPGQKPATAKKKGATAAAKTGKSTTTTTTTTKKPAKKKGRGAKAKAAAAAVTATNVPPSPQVARGFRCSVDACSKQVFATRQDVELHFESKHPGAPNLRILPAFRPKKKSSKNSVAAAAAKQKFKCLDGSCGMAFKTLTAKNAHITKYHPDLAHIIDEEE